MRLLQLVTDDDHLLDLHPQVSVLRSPDPSVRAQLVAAVTGLAQQEAAGTGLLEAHGVLFDLDPELLSLLDRRVEVDPVVRAADLPGGAHVDGDLLVAQQAAFEDLIARMAAAVEAHQAATVAVDDASAALARSERTHAERSARLAELERERATRRAEAEAGERRAQAEQAAREESARRAREAAAARASAAAGLEAAERARDEAAAQLEAASSAAGRLRAEHDRLTRQRELLQARLRPDAAAGVAASLSALRDLSDRPSTDAAPAGGTPDPGGAEASGVGSDPEVSPAVAEEVLAARLVVIEEVLAQLDELDPLRVQAALAEARSPAELVPSAEAIDLAGRIAALDEQIAAAEAGGVPDVSGEESSARAEELDAARAAVADAEDAARSHALPPADAAELEAAHAALHDALERGESRLGGARARARVERLRAAEQELLDRLGFVTYAEYLMGTSSAHRRPEAEAELARARERLAEAEAAWAEVDARRRAVLAHGELLDRRRQATDAARALLGPSASADDDLVGALRSLLRPAVDAAERARALAEALSGAGIELGEGDLELEDLEAIADAWLDEVADVEDRRRSLQLAHDEAATALAAARDGAPPEVGSGAPGSAASSPHEGEAPRREPGTVAALDEAVRAAEAAQDRWEAHETAVAALEGCSSAIAELAPALEQAEEALALAHAAAEAAATAAEAAEREVLEVGEAAGAAERSEDAGTLEERVPPELVDDGLLEELQRELETAALELEQDEVAHRRALEALAQAAQEVEELSARGEVAAAELEALQELQGASPGAPPDPAELEWYLVARVAAQRSVSVAGSAPLLLDDPFRSLSEEQVHHLLGRLERVAETVQIIVLSDHPAVETWVGTAGEARAALVAPSSITAPPPA